MAEDRVGQARVPGTSQAEVTRIASWLNAAGVVYQVGGGWAVDALTGRQTRIHCDLDLFIDAAALPRFTEWLVEAGYQEAGNRPPDRMEFVRGSERVDIRPMRLGTSGDGNQESRDDRQCRHTADSPIRAYLGSSPIIVAHPRRLRELKENLPQRAADRHDLAMLEQACGLDPRPRIVLVHGTLSSAASWEQYPALLPRFDVVPIDLPGHGSRQHETFTMSRALEAIHEAVGGYRPTVLAGHSLGGYIASLYAARNPDELQGLVLMGASGDPGSRIAGAYRAYAWLVDRVDHDRLARFRDRLASLLGVRESQLLNAADYATLPAIWDAVLRECPASLIGEIPVPVLLLNGQIDQMRLSERDYLARASHGELRIVKNATHLAPLTHPATVAAELDRFVRRVCLGPEREDLGLA